MFASVELCGVLSEGDNLFHISSGVIRLLDSRAGGVAAYAFGQFLRLGYREYFFT